MDFFIICIHACCVDLDALCEVLFDKFLVKIDLWKFIYLQRGFTSLHMAAEEYVRSVCGSEFYNDSLEKCEVVKVLMTHGAKPWMKNLVGFVYNLFNIYYKILIVI